MKTNTKNDELRLKACKQYNVGRILDDWLHTWSPTDVRIIIVNSLYESINWKSFCREKITIEFIFELKLYSESSLFFFFFMNGIKFLIFLMLAIISERND